MFAAGLYPGVDYDVEEVLEGTEDEPFLIRLRPSYPLVEKLERDDWPIDVPFSLAPRWMSPRSYNILTAVFTSLLAAGGLLAAVALSTVLTLSVVPSESMVPTILPRDVLLVEKVSPRFLPPSRGTTIFFRPPEALREIATARRAEAGLPALREDVLFVKRIAAVPGDTVSVDRDGTTRVTVAASELLEGRPAGAGVAPFVKSRPPGQLAQGSFWVLGDNAEVSIDSRCWGELRGEQLVGRPLLRVLPPSRFGVVH